MFGTADARVFPEPLVPVGVSSAEDKVALAAALLAFVDHREPNTLGPVARFMETHPTSVWQPSLLVNAGLVLLQQGFSRGPRRISGLPGPWQTTDRSQLQNLLTYCRLNKGRVHFVVVFNLTRFARDKYDHFALRSHLQSLGISLRSATEPIDDTSTGKLMEGVLAAFAQFDNDCRSDRTRAGMKAALELGRWVFLAPIGYLNAPRAMGKSLMPDPERAPLVRRAFEEYATGRFTKQQLLNSQEPGA
jgi:DNA invertase Pin-like site-specific DNA recombinase